MEAYISHLTTESRNPVAECIDRLSTLEMVRLFNAEDARVAPAVGEALPQIAKAIDGIVARIRSGGRLIYVGAGTSGRLGVLDAAECPPTFGTPPGMVVAVLAGGQQALRNAIEEAEDSSILGRQDVAALGVDRYDSVVGIAASGRTPYVIGALRYAHQQEALSISLTCNRHSPLGELADVEIVAVVGPEVLTGSTRLKAATAQKMILTMLSTGVMIQLGRTYGNLMVCVQPTSDKLRERANRIVQEACGLTPRQSAHVLDECEGEVKTAIVASLLGCSPQEARLRLDYTGGVVRAALETRANG